MIDYDIRKRLAELMDAAEAPCVIHTKAYDSDEGDEQSRLVGGANSASDMAVYVNDDFFGEVCVIAWCVHYPSDFSGSGMTYGCIKCADWLDGKIQDFKKVLRRGDAVVAIDQHHRASGDLFGTIPSCDRTIRTLLRNATLAMEERVLVIDDFCYEQLLWFTADVPEEFESEWAL